MTRARRVTLRCICEDLKQDWSEPSDQSTAIALRDHIAATPPADLSDASIAGYLRRIPPLAGLRHPLISSFNDQFSGHDDAGVLRESISAVSDRQWLKQTFSSRWRGAAILESEPRETAWLGAAGYHREGSSEDFYEWFARECASSSDLFIPGEEDRRLERVDRKISTLDGWKHQVFRSALVLLSAALDAGSAGPLIVPKPEDAGAKCLEISIAVDVIEDAGETLREATVLISPAGWEFVNLGDVATRVVLAAIEPRAENWRSAPLVGPAMSHAVLVSAEAEAHARAAAEGEALIATVPGDIRLGTIAHYARASQLTSATVEGEPVQAICGYWFVPMHDHEGRDVCPTCSAAHESLPE